MSFPVQENQPVATSKKSGRNLLLIVLGILGLLVVLCGGGCLLSVFFGGKTVAAMGVMGSVLSDLQQDAVVAEKLGENIHPTGVPTASSLNMNEGGTSTVDFEIEGSKGKGKVHAETVIASGVMKPKLIKVSADGGWTHDIVKP